MSGPPLSVVMPVLNAQPYLDAAVASILGQSDGDFEFVILDDGSTDGSREALRGWAARDPRIRLFEGESRRGPAGSSNFVVAEARAPLIARMDADDLSRPERLARQMAAMAAAPDAVLVASLSDTIDAAGRLVRTADRARLVRPSPFAPFGHSSILFRKAAFDAAGGYREAADKWEDVDLYLRLAERGRMLVLNEVLVSVRQSVASTRLGAGRDAFEQAMDRMYRCLGEYAAGRDYGPLLREPAPPAKLRPEAFIAVGALPLWAGRSPRLLGRVRRRAALGATPRALATLAWAAWADASPRTLRLALRALLRLRNAVAERRLRGRGVMEWRPQDARREGV